MFLFGIDSLQRLYSIISLNCIVLYSIKPKIHETISSGPINTIVTTLTDKESQ